MPWRSAGDSVVCGLALSDPAEPRSPTEKETRPHMWLACLQSKAGVSRAAHLLGLARRGGGVGERKLRQGGERDK